MSKHAKEPRPVELTDEQRADLESRKDLEGFQLTEAQRAQIAQVAEQARQQLAEMDAKKEVPVDQYVGRTPDQIEEADAAIDAATPPPDTSSAGERRIKLLEEQLAETTALVQKLAADKGGYNAVAREVAEQEQERRRRVIYERIYKNGGVCTVVLHTHEDPAQNWPVPVFVNGHGCYIRRGEQTVITAEQLEVLDHAKYDFWVKEVDSEGNPKMQRHERLSYPYSLLDYSGARLEGVATA